ncbi:MAG: hypothetical protein ACK5NK_11905 [Niabella sp.]
MKKFFAILCVVIIVSGCNFFGKKEPTADEDSLKVDLTEIHDSLKNTADTINLSPISKDSVLMGLTKDIFTVFKSQQYSKLDTFIHPTEGIRFSPYATVGASDRKYSKEGFRTLVTSSKNKRYNWGSYDGSGEPIILTPKEYFRKFVYDANFVNPEKAGVNKVFQEGNSVNNLKTYYRDIDFTDSYFSGGQKSGGMDWKSVRLIFKEIDGKYYLVGVVHDQWTI